MAKRYELPDAAWDLVADIFDDPRRSGRPRTADRVSSAASFRCSVLALLGATCQSASALGQRSINVFVTGVIAERLTRCSSDFTSSSMSKG